jgi:hypothetical protein
MKIWFKCLDWLYKTLDMPGGVWVSLFSLTLLIKVALGSSIGGDAITIYGLVLTNFMINKTAKVIKGE